MTVRELAWIGIDAGKLAHHAVAVDAAGEVLWSKRVNNDQAAIEALVQRAGDTATQIRWAVDLTCAEAALLLAVLATAGQSLVYVPGRTVNRMAGAYAGEAKTDARDAQVIAETARLRRDLTTVTTPDELVTELSLLVSHRADLMEEWVRGVNRLRRMLTAIFPALERAFDYTNRSALSLVSGFQTPDAIRAAGGSGLSDHLRSEGVQRHRVPSVVGKALEAAAQQTMRLPGEPTTAAIIAQLARRLLDLDREIRDVGKLLTSRFRAHSQAAIIESMPGMGPILGANFIVATGGDVAGFGTPARLAAYAGLVPVPRDSGRRTGNLHRPQRYNRTLRHVFYMAAMSSMSVDGPSKRFYQRKRGEGRKHVHAVIALARRLVDVQWALLRDNRLFTLEAPIPVPAAA
jgi:transposase